MNDLWYMTLDLSFSEVTEDVVLEDSLRVGIDGSLLGW